MPDRKTLEELRAEARAHARQLEAVHWHTVQDLAVRWGIGEDAVRAIPADRLPYLRFGKSRMRRYSPDDVETFEREERARSVEEDA